jgi:staphylococcal nuclease domain-containing protein 1
MSDANAAPAASGAAPAESAPAAAPKTYFSGIVKQVLDGGAVVIRGAPRNGPPPERTLALGEVNAPRMARRPGTKDPAGTADEPFAWEAREFLRKLLVGKPVLGCVSHTVNSGREYGALLYGSTDPEKAENVAVKLAEEGLVKVRENSKDPALLEAQEKAKTLLKGVWGADAAEHVRDIKWDHENPRQIVDRLAGKPVQAVIEHVRDGTTVRAFLLPDFYHVTLMMSGVRSPSTRTGGEGKPESEGSEPFALEAHYFTESRLLQRDVEIILESVNNKNFIGSVVHPNGSIAEALLREGFAKCVDWSLQCVTGGPEKYRKAQAEAKESKKRLWKDYAGPTGPQVSDKDKAFTGKVVEIVNGDAIMVKRSKTDTRRIHLASIRPPRLPEGRADRPKTAGTFRPLYDIPFMFEAREFLRKKLINQNVHVTIDYIQEANNDFPEKYCGTVTIGGVNVAEALVSKGFATVVRYSADNDRRSACYDDLLAAEDKALKSLKGLHDLKNIPARRIADITGDVNKSKQFLPFLTRAGKMQAVVEFVASGSRFRTYIPRETCTITFLLSGIQCPRASRTMPGGIHSDGEPFGDEALTYVKEMVMQREVEIQVEGIDKGGNFIGWMIVDGNTNVSVALCEEGFAKAFIMQEQTQYGRLVEIAEMNAKGRKAKRWANFVEAEHNHEEEKEKEEEAERKVNNEKVVVTEVTDEAKVYAQHVEEGPKLEALMNDIRAEFTANPPLSGAYVAKRGDLCAAKFAADDQWYRAKIVKMTPTDAHVLYVDYGNSAVIAKGKCATLPGAFTALPPFAKEYCLALCQLPSHDEDYAAQGLKALREDLLDKQLNLNVEYRVGGTPYVSLSIPDDDGEADVIKNLIFDGLLIVDRKGGRRMAKLVAAYTEAMEQAKRDHLNIWEYGDITVDDAREFGAAKPKQ